MEQTGEREGLSKSLPAVIGTNIRSRRVALAWDQPELAERMGRAGVPDLASAAAISKTETGRRVLDIVELVQIARVLGTSPFMLLWPAGLEGKDEVALPDGGVLAELWGDIVRGTALWIEISRNPEP